MAQTLMMQRKQASTGRRGAAAHAAAGAGLPPPLVRLRLRPPLAPTAAAAGSFTPPSCCCQLPLSARRRRPVGTAGAVAAAAAASAVTATAPLGAFLPLSGPWGVWAALAVAGAFGVWAERNTSLGKELSGALVATLVGMALANTGVLPPHPPEATVVFKFLLPLAVPMLLLAADLRRIVRETGRLLLAFLLGAATTTAGTLIAAAVVPLGPALGAEGWKIAAALTARHIGGAVNYMAICETLKVDPSIFGAGLAADDLILVLYFTTIYALARDIPPDAAAAAAGEEAGASGGASTSGSGSGAAAAAAKPSGHGGGGRTVTVQEGSLALALAAAVCWAGGQLAAAWSCPGQSITIVTGARALQAPAAVRPAPTLLAAGSTPHTHAATAAAPSRPR